MATRKQRTRRIYTAAENQAHFKELRNRFPEIQVDAEDEYALSCMPWSVLCDSRSKWRLSGHDGEKHIKGNRFVMERKLGRALKPDEHVYHLDGDALNVSRANLEVRRRGAHLEKYEFPRGFNARLLLDAPSSAGKEVTLNVGGIDFKMTVFLEVQQNDNRGKD